MTSVTNFEVFNERNTNDRGYREAQGTSDLNNNALQTDRGSMDETIQTPETIQAISTILLTRTSQKNSVATSKIKPASPS